MEDAKRPTTAEGIVTYLLIGAGTTPLVLFAVVEILKHKK